MKHGARNGIPAEVVEIKTGGVMAHVTVKMQGADYQIPPAMTIELLEALGIEKGALVHVIAKATNVLLVTP